MHVGIVSLFPSLIAAFASTSIVGRAIEAGLLALHVEDLRSHGIGRYKSVDDTPYGGGSGMVLRADCVVAALDAAEATLAAPQRPRRILLTPQGERFSQRIAEELVADAAFILACGRYEGFDERVRDFVDREISLGDFVLAGGEVAAMAVVEATARLVPGVLGNSDSARVESFSSHNRGLLEFPQFTRPLEYRGRVVPEILRGGNHAEIEAWRAARALERTRQRRPDLARTLDPAADEGEPPGDEQP